MERTGLVPVFYNPDPETAKAVLKACFEGGIRLFEFADRGPGANAWRNSSPTICRISSWEREP